MVPEPLTWGLAGIAALAMTLMARNWAVFFWTLGALQLAATVVYKQTMVQGALVAVLALLPAVLAFLTTNEFGLPKHRKMRRSTR